MNFDKISPTIGLNIAKVEKGKGNFVFWDVGGQAGLRKLWHKYYTEAHGLIFIIDGANSVRLEEVKETI